MVSRLVFSTVALSAAVAGVQATSLTLNDYPKFKDGSAKNNPPTCAMPYDSLDLDRITAWSDITSDKAPQCGSCAQVCGGAGCEYLLVVDQCTWGGGKGADHLDISTGAGKNIVGSDTGNWDVKMTLVDVKNCAGIWDGRMFNSWDEPNENLKALQALSQGGIFAAGASSAPVVSSAAGYATPTTSSVVPYSPSAVSFTVEAFSTPEVFSTSTSVPYSSPAPYVPASSTLPQSSTVVSTSVSYTSSLTSSSSPVEPPSSYTSRAASSVQAVSTKGVSSSALSAVTGYAGSAISLPHVPIASTLVSAYSSSTPSNSIVPASNGTIPYSTASPSATPYTGAGVKTTMSLSRLVMSCLLVAMVVLA